MTQIMEEIVANRAVSVTKEFLATRQQDCVPWGVLLAMKESTVTNVNSNIIKIICGKAYIYIYLKVNTLD